MLYLLVSPINDCRACVLLGFMHGRHFDDHRPREISMKALVYEGPRKVVVKEMPDAKIERGPSREGCVLRSVYLTRFHVSETVPPADPAGSEYRP